MDELKALIELVAKLPTLTVWVLLGYLVYKLAVVGSTYGVIRLALIRLFDWLQQRKAREVEYKEIRPMLDGVCIRAHSDKLIAQLHRLRGKGLSIESSYIHEQSIDWLREAIDAQVERDSLTKSQTNKETSNV